MLRTLFFATVFFLVATAIAIQPACYGWDQKPLNKISLS